MSAAKNPHQPRAVRAVPEMVALAATTRPDLFGDALDRDERISALESLIVGALTAGVPWEWALRAVPWQLADPDVTLRTIETALYSRVPGKAPSNRPAWKEAR